MSQQPDAIIIGTGVIGTAVAFEMAKNGWKTLSFDRNAQIGHGSTAGSCAIIRMHYSTFDGTAFAWEGTITGATGRIIYVFPTGIRWRSSRNVAAW